MQLVSVLYLYSREEQTKCLDRTPLGFLSWFYSNFDFRQNLTSLAAFVYLTYPTLCLALAVISLRDTNTKMLSGAVESAEHY